jgi:hypothetical protein
VRLGAVEEWTIINEHNAENLNTRVPVISSWATLAAEFIAAKRESDKGDTSALQAFVNTALASLSMETSSLSDCTSIPAPRSIRIIHANGYRGELKPEDLDYLNESCKQGWPLARGGRRGTDRGKLLAQIQNRQARQQAMRDQNQPQRSFVESYSDWIDRKCGEYQVRE